MAKHVLNNEETLQATGLKEEGDLALLIAHLSARLRLPLPGQKRLALINVAANDRLLH